MDLFKSFAAFLAGEQAAPANVSPGLGAANLPRPGVNPVRRDGGSFGPNQIAWCDENLTGFKEYRLAAKRVADLYEESRNRAGAPTVRVVA